MTYLLSAIVLRSLAGVAHAIDWDARWNKFRAPVAGGGFAPGSNFLIELALGWFRFISMFIGAAAVLAFLWGAITTQLTFLGEGKKDEGKKLMITALVGLAWALIAYGVVEFAATFLTTSIPVCTGGSGAGCP